MNDNYCHEDNTLIYITENIPGPTDFSKEYESLNEKFNSQIMKHCECNLSCVLESCMCLEDHRRSNYESVKKNKEQSMVPLNECNSLCSCIPGCGNRIVQRGPNQYLNVKPCANPLKGLGLFAGKTLVEGTFVCEYAGEVITRKQAETRQQYNKENGKMNYIFCLNEHSNDKVIQTFVDPSCFGNIGRYINHSCEPNCIIIPVRVDSLVPKLAIFTCLNVSPDEELCIDYGCNRSISNDKVHRKKCFCGSQVCRKFMPFDQY